MLMPFTHYIAPSGTVMTAATSGLFVGFDDGSYGSIDNPETEDGDITQLTLRTSDNLHFLRIWDGTVSYFATITVDGSDYALSYVGAAGSEKLYTFSPGSALFADGNSYEVSVST